MSTGGGLQESLSPTYDKGRSEMGFHLLISGGIS